MLSQDTIIILDWDDTLFPTTWCLKNGINLMQSKNRAQYARLFKDLDIVLSVLIKKLQKYGKVVIVTNAMLVWVRVSCVVLPKTFEVLKTIKVISARQLCQSKYPTMMEWKSRTFKYVLNRETKPTQKVNVVSIGDAEYEYRALVDLYNFPRQQKLLKTIRLVSNPSYNVLLDQIKALNQVIAEVCESKSHMDWDFKVVPSKTI